MKSKEAIRHWLSLARVQMASESYLHVAAGILGQTIETGALADLADVLAFGSNNPEHYLTNGDAASKDRLPGATRLTQQMFAAFNAEWEIVKHQQNTASGFSGTLFKRKSGEQAGELVLSLRSTEFQGEDKGGDKPRDVGGADLGITTNGYAWAQLEDMQAFYAEVKGQIGAAPLTVTGYSLGGHLAQAFTLLNESAVKETVVFNAAGLGELREKGGGGDKVPNGSKLANALSVYREAVNNPSGALFEYGGEPFIAQYSEYGFPQAAFGANGWQPGLGGTNAAGRVNVYADADYAARQTFAERLTAFYFRSRGANFRAGDSGTFTRGPMETTGAFAKITSLFGRADTDDAEYTANSGFHGKEVSVFIEDQPNWTKDGGFFLSPSDATTAGDFGTTHSITLLHDSLYILDTMMTVSPNLSVEHAEQLLSRSSNKRGVGELFGNGRAEYDSYENFVVALAAAVKVTTTIDLNLLDQGTGGFGNFEQRGQLHAALSSISSKRAELKILDIDTALTEATKDGASALAWRYALKAGNPFVALGVDYSGQGLESLSHAYLTDRAAFLRNKINFALVNENNDDANPVNPGAALPVTSSAGVNLDTYYEDQQTNYVINKRTGDTTPNKDLSEQVIFGKNSGGPLLGGSRDDKLYGGAGDDQLTGAGGNDYLEGGLGSDRFIFAPGQGKDTVVDADGIGVLVFGTREALQGQKLAKAGAAYAWADVAAGIEFEFKPGSSSATRGELILRQHNGSNISLGQADQITIKGFDLQAAYSAAGYLGIKLAKDTKAYVAPDVSDNPFTQPGINPEFRTTSFAEGGSSPVNVSFNTPLEAGQKLRFKLSEALAGLGSGWKLMANGAAHVFQGGELVLDSVSGQSQFFFSLVSNNDQTADASGQIEVTLLSQDGTPVSNEGGGEVKHAMGIELKATHDQDDAELPAEFVIQGDANEPNYLEGTDAAETFDGQGGADLVEAAGGDDVVFNGGQDRDMVLGGDGDDRLIAGNLMPLDWTGHADLAADQAANVLRSAFLDGGAGKDRILGEGGDDLLAGGAGEDLLIGAGGSDLLVGDNLAGSVGSSLWAFQGGDPGNIANGQEIVHGLVGMEWDFASVDTGDADVLHGGAGIDYLFGEGGADSLYGEADNDFLAGGHGNDDLFGGAGADLLQGDLDPQSNAAVQTGDDYLDGGDGNDRLRGNRGNDVLHGGAGNDILNGDDIKWNDGAGNDYLDGGAGNDLIIGGAKDDRLFGGADDDELIGDANANDVEGVNHGKDYLDGESGNDTLVGNGDEDRLFGGEGDDNLFGDALELAGDKHAADYLDGEAGNDQLVGQGGDDRLFGGDGDDVIQGDADESELAVAFHGADEIDAGEGDDTVFGQGGDDLILGGAGSDYLDGDDTTVAEAAHGKDYIEGGEGDDTLLGRGGDDELYGEEGADTLDGGAGNDTLFGGEGGDALVGAEGDDYLDGGAGLNSVEGGAGDDTIVVGGDGGVYQGGEGNDTYFVSSADALTFIADEEGENRVVLFDEDNAEGLELSTVHVRINRNGPTVTGEYSLTSGSLSGSKQSLALMNGGRQVLFENAFLSGATEIVTANGSTTLGAAIAGTFTGDVALAGGDGNDRAVTGRGNDLVHAGQGNDEVESSAGDDYIDGGQGDDLLKGGDGNDVLYGGDGNDTMLAGKGLDAMDGGDGDDSYLLNRGDGIKYISDWRGQNRIRFGEGIELEDLKVERYMLDGSLLTSIEYGDEGDQLSILEMAAGSDSLTFEFSGGESISREALLAGHQVAIESDAESILGSDSHDVIEAGAGTNRILGRQGNDRIYGGGGADYVEGNEGDDFIKLGEGQGAAYGGDGKDSLLGDVGAQSLSGDSGDDVLDGGAGDDSLVGGDGNDRLFAGAGSDTLAGGEGDDIYIVDQGNGVDIVVDEAGNNVIRFADELVGRGLFKQVRGDDVFIGTSSSSGLLIEDFASASWRFERESDRSQIQLLEGGGAARNTDPASLAAQNRELMRSAFHDFYRSIGGKPISAGYETTERIGGYTEKQFVKWSELVLGPPADNELYVDNGKQLRDWQTTTRVISQTVTSFTGLMTSAAMPPPPGTNPDNVQTIKVIENIWEAVPASGGSGGAPDYSSAARWRYRQSGQSVKTITVKVNDGVGSGGAGGSRAGSAFSLPGGGVQKSYSGLIQTQTETTSTGHFDYIYAEAFGHQAEATTFYLNDGGVVWGGAGNDVIYVDGGEDWNVPPRQDGSYSLTHSLLVGGAGDDEMHAHGGRDVFVGGDGSDFMWGGYGEDVYIFNAGESGLDTIFDAEAPTYYEHYAVWPEYLVPRGEGTLYREEGSNINVRSVRVEMDKRDAIRFGGGVEVSQLSVAFGQLDSGDDIDPLLSGRNYVDLHVGTTQTIRVLLAREYDPSLRTEYRRVVESYPGVEYEGWGDWVDGEFIPGPPPQPVGEERFVQDLNESRNTGIEWVEFADGSRRHFGNLIASLPVWSGGQNQAPVLVAGLAQREVQAGSALDFFFGEEVFTDDGGFSRLGFAAELVNGDPLPDWLALTGTRFTGEPPRGVTGVWDIRLTATDASGLSTSTVFSVNVTPADNTAPEVAQPIGPVSTTEDALFSWQVPQDAFTDLDDAADALTISIAMQNGDPLPSWLTFDAATRTLSGTPLNGDVGLANIRITAMDSQGLSASQVVALTVANTNDGPTLSVGITDADATEGVVFQVVLPADAFADEDLGDTLTYQVTLEDGSTLPGWMTFDATTRVVSGLADDAQLGVHRLRVTATDNAGASASTVFSLTLSNVNEGPLAVLTLADAAADEGAPFSLTLPEGLFTDPDAGDTLTLSVTLANGDALPTWLSFDAQTRTLSGIADDDAVGDILLRVVGTDGAGLSATAGFKLTVSNTNDGPVAVGDLINLSEVDGGNLYGLLLANDTDADQGDTLSIVAVQGSGEYGQLVFDSANRTLGFETGGAAYTALAEGETAVETFTYTVRDGAGAESTATVSLTLTGRNDGPTVVNAIQTVNAIEDQALNFVIPSDVFADADAGDVITYTARLADGSALPGWLSFNPQTGRFSGTPDNAVVGAVEIELTATDRAGAAATTTFTLNVANTNDAPITVGTVADQLVNEDSSFTLTLPEGLFEDADGEALNLSVTRVNGDALPAWLSFNPATRTLSGIPGNDDVGSLAIRVTASDATGEAAATDFLLSVANTNDAPVLLTPIADRAIRAGQSSTWAMPATAFVDPDQGDSLSFSASLADGAALPAWLQIDAATGAFSGTPDAGAVGNYSVRVTARDQAGAEVQDEFTLTVAPTEGVTLVGGNGAEILTGGVGDDTIDGRGGADRLFGQAGNDRLLGGRGADHLDGGEGNDTVLAGAGFDELFGREGDDYLNGEDGEDTLDGGTGNDILQGGRGADTLAGGEGNNLLDGGAGADQLVAGGANDILIGGQGRDVITTGAGNDVIAFNRGDGADTVQLGQGGTDTLSLGGDIDLSQLRFQKQGDDLRLLLGSGDSILFDNYYSEGASRSLVNLQIVRSAEASLDPQDPLRDNRVEVFDFNELVARFDAAREANPRRNRWALMDALLDAHVAGSDDAAIGGDLAYRYGADGTVAGLSVDPVKALLANNQLTTQMQTIRPVAALQTSGQTLT